MLPAGKQPGARCRAVVTANNGPRLPEVTGRVPLPGREHGHGLALDADNAVFREEASDGKVSAIQLADRPIGLLLATQHRIADALALSKIRERFGGGSGSSSAAPPRSITSSPAGSTRSGSSCSRATG